MKTLDYIYIAPNGKVDPHNFKIVQERLEQGWELLTIDNGIAYLRRIVLPETSCGPLRFQILEKEHGREPTEQELIESFKPVYHQD